MDQVHDPVGQIAGKIRPEVDAAVFLQSPGHINAGKSLGQGQLDIRISLVVAQQDVETRLLLFDQVVF